MLCGCSQCEACRSYFSHSFWIFLPFKVLKQLFSSFKFTRKLRINDDVEVLYLSEMPESSKNDTFVESMVKSINYWLKIHQNEKILIFLDPALDAGMFPYYLSWNWYFGLDFYLSSLEKENCFLAKTNLPSGNSDEPEDSVFDIFGYQCPLNLSLFSKILYVGEQNALLQNLMGFFNDKALYWKNLTDEYVREIDQHGKNRLLSQRYFVPSFK